MLSFDRQATGHGELDETHANALDRDGSDRDKLVDRLRELGRVVPVTKAGITGAMVREEGAHEVRKLHFLRKLCIVCTIKMRIHGYG
jgi:hypothetical protein